MAGGGLPVAGLPVAGGGLMGRLLSTPRRRAWAAALLWIAALYSILPFVLDLYMGFFRRGLVMIAFTGGAAAACLVAAIRLRRLPEGYPKTRLRVGVILGMVCYPFLFLLQTPGEWVHLPEYLVAGILLHGALRHDLEGGKLLAAGIAAIALAGWGDELIQSFLPGRFFAWRDVFLNIAGGAPPILALIRLDRNPPPGIADPA